jgi:hypothetical protein
MAMQDDELRDIREAFKMCEEAEADNRHQAMDDLEFARMGTQWPEEVKRQRERDRRPCLTVNRMPTFIRQIVNDARMNKPAIKCHPVDNNADVETAKVLNGLIKQIETSSNADVAYTNAIDDAVSMGFGYFRVDVDFARDDGFERDIKIDRIMNPFCVYRDPRSTAVDSSDWNMCFVTEMLTHDEFEDMYPDADKVNFESMTYDMRDTLWYTDETVRVAEYWTREEVQREIVLLSDGQILDADVFDEQRDLLQVAGILPVQSRLTRSHKVTQKVVTGSEVLSEIEWAGRYIPIVPVYGEEVVMGEERHFHSLIHFAKDSQMMYNYWRTAATELVALAPKAPFIGPVGAFNTDSNKWQTAASVNHAFIEYDGGVPPQRQPFAGPPAGVLQESLSASEDIKHTIGMFDASIGNMSNEVSGKALAMRQKEGDVGTYHFIDNLSRAIRHAGRIIVDLIPSVYTEARVLRVLGEDNEASNVPVNQMTQMEGDPEPRIYDLTTGKYDVTVKVGPSFTTQRAEAAEQMMLLVQQFPQAAPVIGDLIAKNLDWPGAEEMAERLQKLLPGALQGADPEKQQMKAQLAEAASIIQQLQADRSVLQQKNQIDANKVALDAQKVVVDKYRAETDRMEGLAKVQKDAPNVAMMEDFQPNNLI